MKLHFGRKIGISFLVLIIFCLFAGEWSLILGFLWPFAMLTWYIVLKFKQRKKFLKKIEELGDIVGMDYNSFVKIMDMPKPKGMTKVPEGMAYSWYFSGSRNTGIVVIVDNGIIVDYELNDDSAFKYM